MDVNKLSRPGRNKRTQVGTTNRHSIFPTKALGNSSRKSRHQRRDLIRRKKSPTSSIAPRSSSSLDGGTSTASSRSQTLHDNHRVREMMLLTSSKSMPALKRAGDDRDNNGACVGERGKTTRDGKTERDHPASREMGQEDEGQANQSPAPADDDPYLTSAQLAHVSGLQPSESDVLIPDPYRHRSLLHVRWINRACQRLGHLANIKYGSVREFFRMYDANCDGVLGFDEFSKGITMCQLDHLFPRSLQRALFDRVDTNKSGSVELDEFAALLERAMAEKVPADTTSAWQERELPKREAVDAELRSVELQPIHDHRSQRIKNKVCHYLNKVVRYRCAAQRSIDAFVEMFCETREGGRQSPSCRCYDTDDLSYHVLGIGGIKHSARHGTPGLGVDFWKRDHDLLTQNSLHPAEAFGFEHVQPPPKLVVKLTSTANEDKI